VFKPAADFSDIAIVVVVGFVMLLLVLAAAIRAAYRNGCCDGYGFAREPRNPGYQEAGRYLRRTMYHRWPELEDDD
jgi:hypothetical protein